MSLTYNGEEVKKIIYNGNNVEKLIYNGVEAFSASKPIGIKLVATGNVYGTWEIIDENGNTFAW